jgi:hypothetical protein
MSIYFVDSDDACQLIYQHRPLENPNEYIRLLKLNSSAGEANILGDLIHTRLEDTCQGYEALSYVWGSTESSNLTKAGIKTNGSSPAMKVTENLHRILRELRPHPGKSPRYLWIDQVCINQNDETEKFAQIMIMDQIYNVAQRTLIWLADGNAQVERAMDLIGTATDLSKLHLSAQNVIDLNALYACEWV